MENLGLDEWKYLVNFGTGSKTLVTVDQVHWCEMARLYVGNLDPRMTARELEDEFRVFGVLRSVWVARKPPGFAFIDFDDKRDAQDAIRDLDGKNGWRVELSHNSSSRGRDRHGASDMKCYECGETGALVLVSALQEDAVHLLVEGVIASHLHMKIVDLSRHRLMAFFAFMILVLQMVLFFHVDDQNIFLALPQHHHALVTDHLLHFFDIPCLCGLSSGTT
ncbi:hypothetical protein ZIOFF_006726 [Zingiber officinale]|uniref:RRM domain-containing protein n=1 Tax=Zingiber officinale TaxID=94328 RepID=A0A8J5HQ47_ZINOF|nr:hypothetical protein ZIOFF_006726 [Zingiber officinale]